MEENYINLIGFNGGENYVIYVESIDTSDTQTTRRSSRLKADRQKAPLWRTKP